MDGVLWNVQILPHRAGDAGSAERPVRRAPGDDAHRRRLPEAGARPMATSPKSGSRTTSRTCSPAGPTRPSRRPGLRRPRRPPLLRLHRPARTVGARPALGGRGRLTARRAAAAARIGFLARRPATEDEVILAFLAGELESPRHGDAVRKAVEAAGGLELLTAPDLRSADANAARRRALAAARGWGTGDRLFAGFPSGVAWTYGALQPAELQRVRYINYSYWVGLSGRSRRPADVAGVLASGKAPGWILDRGTDWCFELAAALGAAPSVGPLILAGTPDLSRLVLLEGHARLTALFVGGHVPGIEVTAYIGTSPEMAEWTLF